MVWFTAIKVLAVGENNVKFAVKLDGEELVILRDYTVVITPAA